MLWIKSPDIIFLHGKPIFPQLLIYSLPWLHVLQFSNVFFFLLFLQVAVAHVSGIFPSSQPLPCDITHVLCWLSPIYKDWSMYEKLKAMLDFFIRILPLPASNLMLQTLIQSALCCKSPTSLCPSTHLLFGLCKWYLKPTPLLLVFSLLSQAVHSLLPLGYFPSKDHPFMAFENPNSLVPWNPTSPFLPIWKRALFGSFVVLNQSNLLCI